MAAKDVIGVIARLYKKALPWRNVALYRVKLHTTVRENIQLQKQLVEIQREREQLTQTLERKNRKLSATLLYTNERNRHIEQIVGYFMERPNLKTNRKLTAHLDFLKQNLRIERNWRSFIMHFEEVNPGFIAKLKCRHPLLSSNDMRFIAYVYMNLTIKEIALVLNISNEACKKRKERIAYKLDIAGKTDLYDYLLTL
ncbi:helix-turn-helix transcriptional regulator [Flavobacterium sp. RHBU_3]|uniref:helix-turn-helix transcriptional regulator n=1 Tax=Flavobacterium sp. RHBU_3 TaxID=3391184 RepID=UPI003984A4E4